MVQTAFAAPLLPIVIIYGLIGLSFFYWIDKYLLLNKRSVMETISAEMPFEMLELLDMALLVFTLSSFYFRYQLSGTYTWLGLLLVLVSVVYILLPITKISLYIFPEKESRNEILTYE